jgi:hypothetical protein
MNILDLHCGRDAPMFDSELLRSLFLPRKFGSPTGAPGGIHSGEKREILYQSELRHPSIAAATELCRKLDRASIFVRLD